MPTIQMEVLEEASIEAIIQDLDTTDELREEAAVRIASCQRIKSRTFKAGELVLRRVFKNMSNLEDGKFQPY